MTRHPAEAFTLRVRWPGWITVALPTGWTTAPIQDGVLALYDDVAGVGALEISGDWRSQNGPVEISEVVELLEVFAQTSRGSIEPLVTEETTIAGSVAAVTSFTKADGSFWKVWQAVATHRTLRLVYTADVTDAGIEDAALHDILRSLRWEPETVVAWTPRPTPTP